MITEMPGKEISLKYTKNTLMGNCRMHILKEAYRLFLFSNVERVTIIELEKITQKVRGTIFYHFKNKQNLFNSVVEEVFLPSFEITPEIMGVANNVTLEEFIKQYKSPEERVINKIKTELQVEEPETGYYNFLNQAHKYHPSFKKEYSNIINRELSVWNMVINRIEKDSSSFSGDAKELANIFMLISTGYYYNKGYQVPSEFDYATLLKHLSCCILA